MDHKSRNFCVTTVLNGVRGCRKTTGCFDPHPSVDALIRSRQWQLNKEDVCADRSIHWENILFFHTDN